MIKTLKILLLFLVILTISLQDAHAQKKALFKRLKTKNGFFVPLPLVTYTPETSFGFGLSAQYLFRFQDDSLSNLSVAGATFLYTINKQFIVNPNWDFYLKSNKYRVAGAFVYKKYPEKFYGIGNETKLSDGERFTAQYILFKNRFTARVIPQLSIGPQYRMEYAFDVERDTSGLLDEGTITGYDGYCASGLGLAAIYDTRDHSMFPFKGAYIIFSNHFYYKWLGSNVEFMNFKIDARRYFNPGKGSHVIAIQGVFDFNTHDPPFKMMALIGGPMLMRGYYEGRYRERHMMAGQVEYRFPIIWRFIGVTFFSLGDVANKMDEWDIRDVKLSWGGGLRFTLDAVERINIRFDFAFTREGTYGFYFQLSEAF